MAWAEILRRDMPKAGHKIIQKEGAMSAEPLPVGTITGAGTFLYTTVKDPVQGSIYIRGKHNLHVSSVTPIFLWSFLFNTKLPHVKHDILIFSVQ